ncbi:acetyltransferase [Microbacterium sp. H1-D42]|uniref:acetyltransferase n=1 Tax=Microbacterium sp. H1-D42 TaxID=2925844 RepID=UPI001F53B612|nr:acetyltransferase [Microbacterium sp. H1-D42]UNK70117.1 acetyltransferase [Microbacterium sp. H1-D42]
MPEKIVVVGAGGFGRETLDVIEAINAAAIEPVWEVVGVVDDGPAEVQRDRLNARDVPLFDGLEALREHVEEYWFVIGIGSPIVRARIAEILDSWGLRAATIVHPAAVVGSQTELEAGTVVCGGVQLSTNLRLGAHVQVNPGAIIGHDTVLEDFVSINPGAIVSGEVRVQRATLIGAGATVLQGLTIGQSVTVGAAACVTKDVQSNVTVMGIPARVDSRDAVSKGRNAQGRTGDEVE